MDSVQHVQYFVFDAVSVFCWSKKRLWNLIPGAEHPESLHSKPIWSWISKHSQRWSGSDLQKHILCICMYHFCSSDVINLIWIQSGYSKTDFGCKLDLSEYAQRSNRINEWFSAKYSWWGFFFIPWLFIVSLFKKRLVSLALHISNNEWKLWEITH